MGRLLAISGGVVWLLSIGLIAFAVHWSERPRVPPLATVPTLLRELSAARASQFKEGEAWVVTKVTSAHHVLLVNIDAERVGDAQTIAAEIVAPVKERGFDEILGQCGGLTSTSRLPIAGFNGRRRVDTQNW